MTLRRLGRDESAEEVLIHIDPSIEIVENGSYYRRILMYQGRITSDSLLSLDQSDEDYALSIATQGYGVGNWHLCNGDTATAIRIFEEIVNGEYWPAFGYIAAEADLERLLEIEPI